MTMKATLLHRDNVTGSIIDEIDLDKYGTWVEDQDPLTGQIVRVWKEHKVTGPGLDGFYGTPDDEVVTRTTNCIARGIVDGGIRVAGTTERFGSEYENVDYVKMWVPPGIRISKADRVTNIRDPRGRIVWADEEYTNPFDPNDIPKATVFNVNGVTPLFNAFNQVTEQYVMLQRASVSGGS